MANEIFKNKIHIKKNIIMSGSPQYSHTHGDFPPATGEFYHLFIFFNIFIGV